MNYYEARRQESGEQYWHWTCLRDSKICICDSCSPACVHKTREEAERHFYEWTLDNLIEETLTGQRFPCAYPGCSVWTSVYMASRRVTHGLFLCDKHRNRENFKNARPFRPGLIISSPL